MAALKNKDTLSNSTVFDLLKILEKDPECNLNKDPGLDKFDWISNEKCLELFKNYIPCQDGDSSSCNLKQGSALLRKNGKEQKQELKTIVEEESLKTIKKPRVFEKINNFHKNQLIFKNSFSEFAATQLELKERKFL